MHNRINLCVTELYFVQNIYTNKMKFCVTSDFLYQNLLLWHDIRFCDTELTFTDQYKIGFEYKKKMSLSILYRTVLFINMSENWYK